MSTNETECRDVIGGHKESKVLPQMYSNGVLLPERLKQIMVLAYDVSVRV